MSGACAGMLYFLEAQRFLEVVMLSHPDDLVCDFLRENAGESYTLIIKSAEGLWSIVKWYVSCLSQYMGATTPSLRNKHEILYMFEAVCRSGFDAELQHHLQFVGKRLPTKATRPFLRHCREMLANMPKQGPFSADAWEQLGVIRDEFLSLLESTLGARDSLIEDLKMSSLDKEHAKDLAWSMDQVLAMADKPAERPSFVCSMIANGLKYIETTVSNLTSPH